MGKINVAELLRGCPSGMELDCTMYDGVYFDHVDDLRHNSIKCYVNNGNEHFGIALDEHGQYISNKSAKCVIFPKGKTSWEGFKRPFKDGDILTTNMGSIFIFSHLELDRIDDRNICRAYVGIRNTMPISLFHTEETDIFGPYESLCKFATEEEKEKLFQTIKDNGYRWDSENKILEKLTELTESSEDVDDRLVMSGIYFDRENYADEVELHLNKYEIEIRDGKTYAVFKNQETKTDKLIEPIFKVGDRIRCKVEPIFVFTITNITKDKYECGKSFVLRFTNQDKYELVPNKFDINTLVPFDSRVLVRHTKDNKWCASFFSHIDEDFHSHCYKFVTTSGKSYPYCIPYVGNEHLLNTTNDCDDFYKNL